MSNKRLKVGIVGAGGMAREHARAFRDIVDVDLVGIASRTMARANDVAAEFSIQGVYGSIAELVGQTKPDILAVAVNEPATVAVMRECMGQAATILVEKPVGVHLADCRAVAGLAAAAGTPVFVGLNRRSYGAILAAQEQLSADDGPRFIEVHDQEDIAAAREAGRPEEVIRNWMFANSIHMVDFFRTFGRGEVEKIGIIEPWRGKAPAHVVAHLTFSSGDTGLYHAVWNLPGPWSCAVTTVARHVEMRPVEKARIQFAGSRNVIDLPMDPWDLSFKPGFRRQAEEIAAFIRSGVKPGHVPDIGEALATTELVARLYAIGGVSA